MRGWKTFLQLTADVTVISWEGIEVPAFRFECFPVWFQTPGWNNMQARSWIYSMEKKNPLQLTQSTWRVGKCEGISASIHPSWELKTKAAGSQPSSDTLINWNQTPNGIVEGKSRIFKGFISYCNYLNLSVLWYTEVLYATLSAHSSRRSV